MLRCRCAARATSSPIVAENVSTAFATKQQGGDVAIGVRMNSKTQFFNYGFANLARNLGITAIN